MSTSRISQKTITHVLFTAPVLFVQRANGNSRVVSALTGLPVTATFYLGTPRPLWV